jgi:PAS domain S-box-containing protein
MNVSGSTHEWLAGGGEMSRLILATDWSATPLGPIDTWPPNLRTTVSLCLASNFPINIIWGPEAIQIYNSGYRVVCGAAHPRAIGESYRVTWASAWPAIGEPFEKARRGETSYLENQRMFLERNGYLEETFFTFSLSPIRDEAGQVAGLFHPVTETTAAVLSERRTRALRDVVNDAGGAGSVEEACGLIVKALSHYRHDVPCAMFYRYDAMSDAHTLLGATGVDAKSFVVGHTVPTDVAPWPFREVLEAGQGVMVDDVMARVGAIACADYPEPIARAFVVAIKTHATARPSGFAVVGLSTRLRADEAYQHFIEMLGKAVGTAIASALAYEEERHKAEALSAIDKAKTVFFSNVSHEFRTPLTLMLGPIEDALADTAAPLPTSQRERLERVNRNALRLLKLVNTLLDFSRIQAGRVDAAYRPVDLQQLTADLASVFRAAIEKAGLAFKVDIEDLGAEVHVDRDMWEKIVLNLLSNAFKFTLHGEIEVRLERRGDRAYLTVRDTGIGIPASEIPNLFQRFHQVEGSRGRTYEGSGIGLALIDELVRLHGGTTSVQSQEGSGSVFEISIPFGSSHLPADRLRARADAESVSVMRLAFQHEASGWLHESGDASLSDLEGAAPANSLPLGTAASAALPVRRRIVIAEDNADMRAYLTGLLRPLGTVEAVVDGEAAWDSIRRSRPDLIVSDVMMPRLDGLGLLERLRGDPSHADIPFMLLSARAGEESRIEGLRQGADDFLSKPFAARELVARATTQLKLGEARRTAETERARLFDFFMQAPIPMVVLLGPDHRFVLANEPYERLIGQKVVGKTVLELFAPPQTETFIPLLDRVYATGQPFVGREIEFPLPDGHGTLHGGFIDVSYHPFREASGEIKGVLAIVLDVTEQVRARKTIEAAVVQLTEERAIREQFVTTLTHDLRSPLSAMLLSAQILDRNLADPETLKRVAGRIDRSARRMDTMICDLLDANRLSAGARMPQTAEPGYLDQITETTVQGLIELHGTRFQSINEAGAVPGLWDSKGIQRVIENLAGNAVKYGMADSPITVSLVRLDDWAELRVHNEGTPISPGEQVAIFEPFHQTRSGSGGKHSGWGVGLTLVKGIGEAHGGNAGVHSDATTGTTFFVRFPIGGLALG